MRISKKQVHEAFLFYKLKYKEKELWQGLTDWSIFEEDKKGCWINKVKFKNNKDIYNFLKKERGFQE